MPKEKKPDYTHEEGHYRVEMRRRRDCVHADVYRDGEIKDELVETLEYPRLAAYDTAGLIAFAQEAVSIAERNREKGA